jgi:hypothetical protein
MDEVQPAKQCRDCGIEKPLDDFPLQKGGKLGRHPLCKPCRAAQEQRRYWRNRDAILEEMRTDPKRKRRGRRWRLRTRYALTEADYWAMYASQSGCCAICERIGPVLVVDHDHRTGEVRGLLCHNCNFAVGELDDDPARMIAAASYLERVP